MVAVATPHCLARGMSRSSVRTAADLAQAVVGVHRQRRQALAFDTQRCRGIDELPGDALDVDRQGRDTPWVDVPVVSAATSESARICESWRDTRPPSRSATTFDFKSSA
jgi:hypothetical protein